MKHARSLLACLLLPALAAAGAASAQEVLLYRAGETPDARDVARVLGARRSGAEAGAESPEDMRTRSLSQDPEAPRTRGFKLSAPAGRPEAARPERVARPRVTTAPRPGAVAARAEGTEPAAVALGIQFDFDSAEILPPARTQLDALADGIRMLAPEQRVVIEGHTDAAGGEQYNLGLSQRRAESVKRYLTEVQGIDAGRLATVGLGKTRPLDPRDPMAQENRRVQFHGD
ncbi:MAG: OmpA family protein [Pseudomonas sp.]